MSTLRRRRDLHGSSPSLNRSNVTACFQCRRKKKRCDQKLPRCTLCEATGAECVGYDAVAGRNVPRSYILSLEQRVAFLEQKLRDHGIHDDNDSNALAKLPVTSPSNDEDRSSEFFRPATNRSSFVNHATIPESRVQTISEVEDVVNLSRRRPGTEPALFNLLLEELVHMKHNPQLPRFESFSEADKAQSQSAHMMDDLDASTVSLPPKEAASNLVNVYFQFTKSGMPLLHEPTFRSTLDLVYSKPDLMQFDETHVSSDLLTPVFMVFEVFAVALMIMHKQDPSRVPVSLADRYHKTALKALSKAGIPVDVKGVQALLLIGQYCYHHPIVWAVWKTIGAALRLAVEIGLHHDPKSPDLDALTQDTMRRVFWVAYSMDRNVSIALCIPSCLSDGAITTEFPSLIDDEYITTEGINVTTEKTFWGKCVGQHLLRFRRIQSEMQIVLQEKPPAPYTPIDINQWQKSMHDKIQKWYDNVPRVDGASSSERMTLENYELTYHRALLYLYHPSTNIPTPSETALLVLAKTTPKIIRLYRRFFDERRLSVYWQAVENLSSAGVALIYCFTKSAKIRQILSKSSLEELIRTCSSVLWAMVEHFPAFKGRRDAFDIVASKTLADLATQATTSQEMGRSDSVGNSTGDTSIWGQLETQDASQCSQDDSRDIFSDTEMIYPNIPNVYNHLLDQNDQFLSATLSTDLDTNDDGVQFSNWNATEATFDWDSLEDNMDFVQPAWI